MGFLKKKADPISERARALNAEIAALEAKIKKLDSQLHSESDGPRLRSTALPRGASAPLRLEPAIKSPEPIFEDVNNIRLKAPAEPASTPQQFNEFGVRKYDLLALFERIKKQFRGPPLSNPKLVNYLAAGSIQGLRPLRYEKRVARNRFIAVTIFLALVLLGLFAVFFRNR